MYYYLVLILFISQSVCAFTHSQRNEPFFRNDYHFMDKMQSFYKIHKTPQTWIKAKQICEFENAILFYPLNKEEFDAVAEFWKSSQGTNAYIFIGVSANFIPRIFDTIDGIPITSIYNKWKSGEPNGQGANEDVIEINIVDGLANDVSRNVERNFICKKTLTSLNWNCNIPGDDYTYYAATGGCYKFVLTPKTWTQAYEVCRTGQSYLAIIKSESEASFLADLVKNAAKQRIRSVYTPGSVHLGFYSPANEGWVTLKGESLEKSGYSHFGYESKSDNSKLQCGAMFYNGELRDISCEEKCFFICEHGFKNVDVINTSLVV